MKMNLEVAGALMEQVKSNSSVHAIFKRTIATHYRAYRAGDSCLQEYEDEFNATLYRCALMVGDAS